MIESNLETTLLVKKPWGQEQIWASTDHYIGKILTILPGQRTSLQFHKNKVETISVMSGVLHLELDGEECFLSEGVSVLVNRGAKHRLSNKSQIPIVLLEASTPHMEDVVRVEDDYKRDLVSAPNTSTVLKEQKTNQDKCYDCSNKLGIDSYIVQNHGIVCESCYRNFLRQQKEKQEKD